MDGFHLDRLGLGYTVHAGYLSDRQLLVELVTLEIWLCLIPKNRPSLLNLCTQYVQIQRHKDKNVSEHGSNY